MVFVWKIAIVSAVVALAAFLGVGIIATNATFDSIFQRYFFWIALGWVFFSSSLLIRLVKAFGGNRKDMLSSFLAAIGIWLVVIQVSAHSSLFVKLLLLSANVIPFSRLAKPIS